MADFPQSQQPLPLFVHTWTRWSGIANGVIVSNTAQTLASITWPVASTAFYIPMWLPWPYPVRRVFWINGSAVTSTNMDFGIYSADGAQIYHTGSTAESGVSATQYVTPSPNFVLSPGRYYFALACSTITANCGGQGATSGQTTVQMELAGILRQASALPLPATMTAAVVANVCLPICGVTRTTTGF